MRGRERSGGWRLWDLFKAVWTYLEAEIGIKLVQNKIRRPLLYPTHRQGLRWTGVGSGSCWLRWGSTEQPIWVPHSSGALVTGELSYLWGQDSGLSCLVSSVHLCKENPFTRPVLFPPFYSTASSLPSPTWGRRFPVQSTTEPELSLKCHRSSSLQ